MGLTAEVFIEIMYDKLSKYLRENHFNDKCQYFLRSLGKYMSKDITMDVMHNKYFNSVTPGDPVVHIPSRFYVFNNDFYLKIPQFETTQFGVDETGDFCRAELSLTPNNTYSLNNALKIIQEIQRYQTVTIVMLDLNLVQIVPDNMTLCDQIEKLFPNTIKFNKNTGYFRLHFCDFSKSVFEHLAQELYGCEGIKHLILKEIGNNFPVKLGESIATMTSLEMVKMRHFTLTSDICQEVVRGLSACSKLRKLSIKDSALTDCLLYLFMESNHYGFPCLEILEIRDAKLSTDDLTSLANAVSSGKLPKLKQIDLSRNTLAGKVGILMGFQKGKYFVYPALKTLSFAICRLKQADIRGMSQALIRNQLPRLQNVNLRFNTLTNCMTYLFGEQIHSSYSSLQELNFSCTKLSAVDLRNVSRGLSHHVMSNCKTLDLSGNKLTGKVGELFAGHGLPFLNTLSLQRVQLNGRDIESIIEAIEASKLPALSFLDLGDHKFPIMEDQARQLLEACIAAYNTVHPMSVDFALDDSSDYKEIKKRLSKCCKGTNVHFLCFPTYEW